MENWKNGYVEKSTNGAISMIDCIVGQIASCGQNDVMQVSQCNSGNLYHKLPWSPNVSVLQGISLCCVAQVAWNFIKILKYCNIADNILQYQLRFSP